MIADINNKAHQLTRDHKPSDNYEKERINKIDGGMLYFIMISQMMNIELGFISF